MKVEKEEFQNQSNARGEHIYSIFMALKEYERRKNNEIIKLCKMTFNFVYPLPIHCHCLKT